MLITTVALVLAATLASAAESASNGATHISASHTHTTHSASASTASHHANSSSTSNSPSTSNSSSASNSSSSSAGGGGGSSHSVSWPTAESMWALNGTAYVRFTPLQGKTIQFVLKNEDPSLLVSGNSQYSSLKSYLSIDKDNTNALNITRGSNEYEAMWFPVGGSKTKGNVKPGLGYSVGVAYRSNTTAASDTTTSWDILWSDPFDIGGNGPDKLPAGVTPFAPGEFKSSSSALAALPNVGFIALAIVLLITV